jgi:dimethylargininase
MTPGTLLVRPPSARLAEGIVTHIERTEVDAGLAAEQWQRYVAIWADAGWHVVELPALEDHPDGVFVEDTMTVFGDIAVIARPGAAERRGEVPSAQAAIEAIGLTGIAIEAPGTLDGGDVLKVGSTVYVGRGGRTNADGIRQLREALQPMGARVVAVPVSKVLHLRSAVSMLPDLTIAGYPSLLDDAGFFPSFRPVPEESGAHVVLLGGAQVLLAADAPKTAELYADLGFDPVLVDVSEFQKLEACVTCLSVRVRRPPPPPPPR